MKPGGELASPPHLIGILAMPPSALANMPKGAMFELPGQEFEIDRRPLDSFAIPVRRSLIVAFDEIEGVAMASQKAAEPSSTA